MDSRAIIPSGWYFVNPRKWKDLVFGGRMKKFRKFNYRIILEWLAQEPSNEILKFMCLWIVLNHWYKFQYEKTKYGLSDRECLERIKNDYQVFNRLLNNQNLPRDLEDNLVSASILARKLKFENTPQIFHGSRIEQCQQNYEVIVELLYELRSRIFHGDISIENKNIQKISSCLSSFMKYIVGNIILDPRYTK